MKDRQSAVARVIEAMGHGGRRCPACLERIRPFERTERIGRRIYHRRCARYVRP